MASDPNGQDAAGNGEYGLELPSTPLSDRHQHRQRPEFDLWADQLLRRARTFNAWSDRPVSDDMLRELYELAAWGPTSANGMPMRIVFVRTAENRKRLAPMMSDSNQRKVLEAPVTAIIGFALDFHDRLPELFPHNPEMREWLAEEPELVREIAFRNSSLQAGYLIVAARMLGLDCGPMSGFDPDAVDAAFFPDGRTKSNFLCALGYGDEQRELWPRLPRLSFEDACRLV